MQHLNKKHVLNIDLENFFDSFNFGRVRGFFIKNDNFQLDPHIATVIAQIACYDNKLPQGSPSSPVITNLITHALDIRLAKFAEKNSCTYTRYADDITISTRKKEFPAQIMKQIGDEYVAGRRFEKEINKSGFSINTQKTRLLYKDSRQEVTGLTSNKKPNTKSEYWRTARAQCHRLFKTGNFTEIEDGEEIEGNINKLEGRLNFIDQIDHYNRKRQKKPLNPEYLKDKNTRKNGTLLHGRERNFGRFLYYRWFYGNRKPTILTEGETDITYLTSAIHKRSGEYPRLANGKGENYELKVSFFKITPRMKFLLSFSSGAPFFCSFIPSFNKKHDFYKGHKPQNPVIIVLDNDEGFGCVINEIKKSDSLKIYPKHIKKADIKQASFIHVTKTFTSC